MTIITNGSSEKDKSKFPSISKSYEQLLVDISLCSNLVEPDAIAHCAFKLTHDIAKTPNIPPIKVFYVRII